MTDIKAAEALWDILDNIDSLPDMMHPDTGEAHEKCWKMMVDLAAKRHSILTPDVNGVDLEKV